jgi:hypothetical protein
VLCTTVAFGEKRRHTKQRRAILVAAMVVNHALQGHDFKVLGCVFVIGAIWAVHGVVPVSASTQVTAVGCQCEAAWAPPLSHFFWNGPCIPNGLQWCVIHTGDGDHIGVIFLSHGWFLHFLISDTRQADQADPPTQCDNAPSSLPLRVTARR